VGFSLGSLVVYLTLVDHGGRAFHPPRFDPLPHHWNARPAPAHVRSCACLEGI